MDEETANVINEYIEQSKALHDQVEENILYNQSGGQPPVEINQILSEMNNCLGLLISVVETLTSTVVQIESECEGKMTDAEIFEACFRELVRRW